MKIVQIVGGGYGSDPFPLNLNARVWLVNSVIRARYEFNFNYWTEYFDLHTKDWILDHRPEVYLWFITQDGTKPIYLAQADDEIKGSIAFPFDTYIDYFNTNRFAHTIDWLIAKAIYDKVEQIEFYYCPLDNHDKNTTSYWIGRAEQTGIKIVYDSSFGAYYHGRIYRK